MKENKLELSKEEVEVKTEKVQLNLNKREFITKSFAGQEIKIKPYIDLSDLVALVDVSFESLVAEKEGALEVLDTYDKIVAISKMNIHLLRHYTNIDIDSIDIEVLTTSGLDDYVCKYIAHYNMAKEMLMQLIGEYNQNLALLNMFNSIPDINDVVSENSELAKQLNSIDNEKLKMVTNNIIHDMADKKVSNERQVIKEAKKAKGYKS